MSVFINKKFNSFESYLRKHFKEECTKFEEFSRVYEIDHDAFFAFYLKILLENLENIKRKSKPEVSSSVARKLRPGTRSSIPFPKDGLAAIKSGTIPNLDLYSMVAESLNSAIDSFYNSIHKDKDLIKNLEEVDTNMVKLDELYAITTTPKSNVVLPEVISKKFNILDYLKEEDAKFIYPEIRKNMEYMHNSVVTFLLTQEGLSFEDAIIQYGILPVIMYNVPYIPNKYLFKFNSGNGVGLRVSDPEKFNLICEYMEEYHVLHPQFVYEINEEQQLLIIVINYLT